MRRARIHITGIVQGVGMRPHVYREAMAHGVGGWVLNAGDGVHIEAEAPSAEVLDAFVAALRAHAPAAARIDGIAVDALDEPADGCGGPGRPDGDHGDGVTPGPFRIITSDDTTERTTLVSPDIATCPACLAELFDPADRRYHYPFINCTNCGPRFTIIRALPYDRQNTSMDAFPMCEACAHEYADPADRRFHAQPDACFACGPHLTWRASGDADSRVGATREASDAIIDAAAELIARGGRVAVKGLGGFHLVCNATDEAAVRELRRRKRRSNKPLAVMVADLAGAEALCALDDTERALIGGTVRPIVLLRRRPDAAGALADAVAFDLPELGVMLPYTPLQHLLLAACRARGVDVLVMTSGNVSEEPIETDDALAWEHLVGRGIADALLGNDRPILSRFDDSVVRVVAGEPMLVRRARGYAPRPLPLPAQPGIGPRTVLACGPEQKATVALTREEDAGALCFLSQHIGDVEHAGTFDAWSEARRRLEDLFDLAPDAIACDRHPSYLPSQWAREEARRRGLPLVEVQHHHAHIASVIAEAAAAGAIAATDPVIGLAFDGTGAGDDGTIWGGEVLVATLAGYTRAAHLKPWRLPGGAASVRDARRCAFGLLASCGLEDHPGAQALLARLTPEELAITRTMVARGINSPATSSMGRLMDALAALTGICDTATYEGEPAIGLEARAHQAREAAPLAEAALSTGSPSSSGAPEGGIVIDPTPLVASILNALVRGVDTAAIARGAHEALTRTAAAAARRVADTTGITTVALSGGVFMNRLMLTRTRTLLEDAGLTVLIPRDVPVNDGCIAYGQAAVARAQLAAGS